MATPLISELRVGQPVQVVEDGCYGDVVREYQRGLVLVAVDGEFWPTGYRPEELRLAFTR